MKRVMATVLVSCLAALAANAAFTPPTADQIKAAAEDPATLGALIQGASAEEAAQVVTAVIQEIEKSDLSLDQKKARVALVIDQMNATMGDLAAVVMGIVATTVNPELLPAVGAVAAPVAPLSLPIGQPLAPPIAVRYPGQ